MTDLAGHLGCIAFNEADGCVYGSLEYKNDAIGAGILRSVGKDGANTDGFYIAEPESGRDGHAARVYVYDFDPATGFTKR